MAAQVRAMETNDMIDRIAALTATIEDEIAMARMELLADLNGLKARITSMTDQMQTSSDALPASENMQEVGAGIDRLCEEIAQLNDQLSKLRRC